MKAIEQRRRMRGQGGFTLIELLVVIAILAVLAGVVVFAVGGINDTSKESACKIDKRTLSTAAQAYFAQNQAWAASDVDPETDGGGQALKAAGLLDDVSTSYSYTAPVAPSNSPTYTAIPGNENGCT